MLCQLDWRVLLALTMCVVEYLKRLKNLIQQHSIMTNGKHFSGSSLAPLCGNRTINLLMFIFVWATQLPHAAMRVIH